MKTRANGEGNARLRSDGRREARVVRNGQRESLFRPNAAVSSTSCANSTRRGPIDSPRSPDGRPWASTSKQ